MNPQAVPPESPVDPAPSDLIEIGRVVGAHGIKGWVKVGPHGDAQDSVLTRSRRWWLTELTPGAVRLFGEAAPEPRPIGVLTARAQMDVVVAQLAGVEDRDQAALFRGARIWVSRSEFPPSQDDEYYWVDLIGCRVSNPEGEALGEVLGVEEFGAHPLLNVKGPDGLDRLIPFVAATIVKVDLPERHIVVHWGLDY